MSSFVILLCFTDCLRLFCWMLKPACLWVMSCIQSRASPLPSQERKDFCLIIEFIICNSVQRVTVNKIHKNVVLDIKRSICVTYHSYCGQPAKTRRGDEREGSEQLGSTSQDCRNALFHPLRFWSSPPCTQAFWSRCLAILRCHWLALEGTYLPVQPLDPLMAFGGVPSAWGVSVKPLVWFAS